jgi:hypothetical protein
VGTAYHLKGGWCSDDSFLYFLGWLLAQGRATFEAAVGDPDSLVDHPAVWAEWQLECEAILYAAMMAYEARTGEKLPDS